MSEVETTTDVADDLEELSAEYPVRPKAPRKPRAKNDPKDEVEYTDGLTKDNLDQVQVKMYRRRGSRGWWWSVKIPALRTSWRGSSRYWYLDESSGYAITKWGAQYEIKKCIRKNTHRPEDKIEWVVPIVKNTEPVKTRPIRK